MSHLSGCVLPELAEEERSGESASGAPNPAAQAHNGKLAFRSYIYDLNVTRCKST